MAAMDPQARRRQIEAELATNLEQLQQVRTRRRVENKVWNIKGLFRLRALAIYVVSGCDLDPVVWYVRGRAKRFPTWPEKADDDIKLIILDLVASATDEELDADNQENATVLRVAHDDLLAWRTGTWVRSENMVGHALSGADILCHREDAAAELPVAVRPPSWGPVATRLGGKARKRVFQLQSQFGGYFGCLPLRANIPQEVLLTKAISLVMPGRSCFAVPFDGLVQ